MVSKIGTAVCGTARTVVWEVGKCENRRQMPFVISIYLLPDYLDVLYYPPYFYLYLEVTNCDLKRVVVILRTKVVLLAYKPLLHNPFL